MLHNNWYRKSERLRDVHDKVYETLISELEKPGLTSQERKNIGDEIRRLRHESRQWEEKNEIKSVQYGEGIGTLIGIGTCAFGLILGVGVGIAKKLL